MGTNMKWSYVVKGLEKLLLMRGFEFEDLEEGKDLIISSPNGVFGLFFLRSSHDLCDLITVEEKINEHRCTDCVFLLEKEPCFLHEKLCLYFQPVVKVCFFTYTEMAMINSILEEEDVNIHLFNEYMEECIKTEQMNGDLLGTDDPDTRLYTAWKNIHSYFHVQGFSTTEEDFKSKYGEPLERERLQATFYHKQMDEYIHVKMIAGLESIDNMPRSTVKSRHILIFDAWRMSPLTKFYWQGVNRNELYSMECFIKP